MTLSINIFIILIILVFLVFKKPKIGSYYNPIFFFWVFSFFLPILLSSIIRPDSLNIWILLSVATIFILVLYFPPKIRISTEIQPLRMTSISLILYFIIFFVPFTIDLTNFTTVGVTDFSERNSAIISMPLAVVSRSLSSLQVSFIALSSGLLWKISTLSIVVTSTLGLLNFSIIASKGIMIGLLIQLLTYVYLRNIIIKLNFTPFSSRLFVINSEVPSPFQMLQKGLKSTKLNLKFIGYTFLLIIVIFSTILILNIFNFDIYKVLYRITMNFDTLIFLSDVIRNDQLSVSESGFITIFSVWLKPIVGILNLPIDYPYRSVVQYILSKWHGHYWYSSSLGNSNIVAESVVSSGLYLGVLTSPILMWMFLKLVQRGVVNSSRYSLSLLIPITLYMNSYLFFASAQEYVMSAYVYVLPFLLFKLVSGKKFRR